MHLIAQYFVSVAIVAPAWLCCLVLMLKRFAGVGLDNSIESNLDGVKGKSGETGAVGVTEDLVAVARLDCLIWSYIGTGRRRTELDA